MTVLVALSFSMAKNGANPVQVFSQTVSSGDPEVLRRRLFRTAFNGYGLDEATVRGNIRHEVFGAVLVAMYVSSWAVRFRPLVTRAQRTAYTASMVLSTILLVMSLSRSVMIAAFIWPMIILYRSARTLTLTGRQIVAAYAAIGGVALLAASGFGLVLYNRFTEDTTSYTRVSPCTRRRSARSRATSSPVASTRSVRARTTTSSTRCCAAASSSRSRLQPCSSRSC